MKILGSLFVVAMFFNSLLNGCANGGEATDSFDVSQLEKLHSGDAQKSGKFGKSVSMSCNYIVVGASGEDGDVKGSGAAYLFKKSDDGESVKRVTKIVADDAIAGDAFGDSVAIDGNYIVIGAPGVDGVSKNMGMAYLFKINGDEVKQIAKFGPDDVKRRYDYNFANAVAISGNRVVVGVKNDSKRKLKMAGKAYLFTINDDDTVSKTAEFVAGDPIKNANFGYCVSIDGNYTVVGAPYGKSVMNYGTKKIPGGAAYLFEITKENKVKEIATMIPFDAQYNGRFGNSVSIHKNYIAIGSIGEGLVDEEGMYQHNSGTAYVYKMELKKDTEYDIEEYEEKMFLANLGRFSADKIEFNGGFGKSVAIGDNYFIVTTDIKNKEQSYKSSAYLFKIDDKDKVKQVDKFESSDIDEKDMFGDSISIVGDFFVIGASNKDKTGEAYLFKK